MLSFSRKFVLGTLSFLLILPHILSPPDYTTGYARVSFRVIGLIFPSAERLRVEIIIRSCCRGGLSILPAKIKIGSQLWRLLKMHFAERGFWN
jgi:hypothetical protein